MLKTLLLIVGARINVCVALYSGALLSVCPGALTHPATTPTSSASATKAFRRRRILRYSRGSTRRGVLGVDGPCAGARTRPAPTPPPAPAPRPAGPTPPPGRGAPPPPRGELE